MQKIMFNDRYGLTQAVIDGRKTMTRRLVKPEPEDCSGFHKVMPTMCDWKDEPMSLIFDAHNNAVYCQYCGYGIDAFAKFKFKPKYQLGEIVAVAQSYKALGYSDYALDRNPKDVFHVRGTLGRSSGWNNKMFVRADACKTQIRITGIRCERLQEISDEDCMREGVNKVRYRDISEVWHSYYFHFGITPENCAGGQYKEYPTPREAFASLIDKVSGRGTWQRNPWVVVYEFELVK